ncbi:MAG: hypothetical protein PVG39_02690 [Desulfobacteraceae bacterium]|jgi:hypothetical protein
MPLTAKPLSTAYRNLGEKNYRLGVEIVDADGEAVEITGDVSLIYTDTEGDTYEETGVSEDNIAYYDVTDGDLFSPSGTYKYWIKCFDLDIYGPFELKILPVPEITS